MVIICIFFPPRDTNQTFQTVIQTEKKGSKRCAHICSIKKSVFFFLVLGRCDQTVRVSIVSLNFLKYQAYDFSQELFSLYSVINVINLTRKIKNAFVLVYMIIFKWNYYLMRSVSPLQTCWLLNFENLLSCYFI